MKKPSLRMIFISLSLLIITVNPTPASAHFFPNISAIPASFIPKTTTIWDAFNNLVGCHKGQDSNGLSKLKQYLHSFGYFNSSYLDFSDHFDDHLESAIKTYQLNFNLNATGELDAPTLTHIVLPRCGNPDVINGTSTMNSGNPRYRGGNSTIHAVGHYSFFPNRPRWPPSKSELTYAFQPENQLSGAVRGVFARAFVRWSEVTPLTFREVENFRRADIKIGFFSRDHGDGEAFDGVLGTLAHAFSPPNGRFHLDGEENWLIDGEFLSGSGGSVVDLESVAVHEIGHVLGLGHSSDMEAIMYPTISSGQRKVELANDDIMGVQELYGSNPNYNGSVSLTPRRERDSSGARRPGYSLLWAGSLLMFRLFL